MWDIGLVSIEVSHLEKKSDSTILNFEEKEKVFDPKEVYGDAPNPTKL